MSSNQLPIVINSLVTAMPYRDRPEISHVDVFRPAFRGQLLTPWRRLARDKIPPGDIHRGVIDNVTPVIVE